MKDEGHCTTAAKVSVISCWNFQAGRSMPEGLGDYAAEFLPFLNGWDFRINLPHVNFQAAGVGSGSPAALVGVDEDSSAPTSVTGSLVQYGHRNNSLWALRVQASDRRLYAKQLPSRRDPNGSATENVASLTAGWTDLGTERFRLEEPAATVVGTGLGNASVYVAARRENDDVLMFTRRPIGSTSASLSGSWESLGVTSGSRPSLAPAFRGSVAVAWRVSGGTDIRIRLYTPSTSSFGPPVTFEGPAEGDPQLVWDGTALNLFFVSSSGHRLRQVYASGPDLAFRDQVDVAPTAVSPSLFHAIPWNGRLHVVYVPEGGTGIQYTASQSPFGSLAIWVAPTAVGLASTTAPKLAAVSDTLFAVGVSGGKVRFARRDATVRGPEATGSPVGGIWLTAGQLVDPRATGTFSGDPDLLSWNGDVYLVANVFVSGEPGVRLRLVNLSRAVFKQLITQRWNIKLRWGEFGGGNRITNSDGAPVLFAKENDIPMLGDVDNDGASDLIKFTQRSESGVGPAPVYVARAPKWQIERWHKFFSLKGEIPRVGDFNRDGKDDIVSFVQKGQKDAAGKSLGPAPVWVSLSNGTSFQTSRIWHRFFSLKGEVPLVGDFNGDRRDDIVTFVQKKQTNIGSTPVYVSLSDGSRFQTSRVWHTFFSLKGEIPLVGDFNGDGKDDIVTFVQKKQNNIGTAPVYVALSNGTRFLPSRVWHTFFSLKGEVPLVGDFNLDGRDDIVTFLHDRVSGERARNVYVALSTGSSFSRSFVWMSDFAGKDDIPAIGNLGGTLSQITGRTQDASRKLADLFAFRRKNSSVYVGNLMGRVPYPSGAPWERYKWFTDKGLGVAGFPEWIYQRPKHCLSSPHFFILLGAGGSGDEGSTNLSVRSGSRQGHVLEELLHGNFAACFRKSSDPLYAGIYTGVGIDAGNLWGGGPMSSLDCPNGTSAETITAHPLSPSQSRTNFYDCRKDVAEHYFLQLLRAYKYFGDEFRALIQTTKDTGRQFRLVRQYNWLRDVWFGGAEFKRGAPVAAGLTQEGLLCLPGECISPVTRIVTFDNLTTGGPGGGAGSLVTVSSQFSSSGVTFNNLSAIDYSKGSFALPGFAHSGNVAVEPCVGVEFCTAPVRASFSTPQRRVKVWVGFSFPHDQALTVQLRAFAGSSVVGTTSVSLPATTTPTPVRSPLELTAGAAVISQLEVTIPGGFNNALAVDDVEFGT